MLTIPKLNGSMIIQEGAAFRIKDQFAIGSGDFKEASARVFLQRVEIGTSLTGENVSDANNADIVLVRDSSIHKEAYTIEVNESGIRVLASEDAGMTWALATLYQLIVEAIKNDDNTIAAMKLEDAPKYAHRGLHVDVARHFFDVTEMKRIIEEMSVYKLNVLHWHLTDDQGWRIESKVHPKLNEVGAKGSYYTQQQIREIVAYAEERSIEIVPEIDMPGHSSAAIASYPLLSCFDEEIPVGEKAGIYKVIMCAGKESTYEWLYPLMNELVELFPSNRFHIGGDEAPKEKWKTCPHCNAYMQSHQLESYEDLQGAFTAKVASYLADKGKQVSCWNESLQANNLPKDITVQYWTEMAQQSYVYPHFEQGRPMIFSELFHMYFDYPHCIVPLKKTYEYEPGIMGHRQLKGDNVLGIEGAIWTERVETNAVLETMISPRIQALAEAAWTHDRNYEDFLIRLKAHMSELGLVRLQSTPLEQAAISGEEAKAQAIGFMQAFLGALSSGDIEMGLSAEEMRGLAHAFLHQIFDPETAQEVAKSLLPA